MKQGTLFKIMTRENKMPLFLLFVICFIVVVTNRALGQKTIVLNHHYITKGEKLYNMAGGEVYAIVGNDTVFLPKKGKYEFTLSAQLDSLISISKMKRLWFLVKTPQSKYYISVLTEIWHKYKQFKFSFYKSPEYGDQSAVTFEEVSSTSPAIIIPNKEWQRKFYPYEGR